MAYVAVDSPLFDGRALFPRRRRLSGLSALRAEWRVCARMLVDFLALAALMGTLYGVVAMAGVLTQG